MINRISNKNNDIESLQNNLLALDTKLTLLTVQIRKYEDGNKQFEKQRLELINEKIQMEENLKSLQEQLEEEAMTRMELANELQDQEEQAEINRRLHEVQFTEILNSSREAELNEKKQKLEAEYEGKFHYALDQLRYECELQLQANREEQEYLYSTKMSALRGNYERLNGTLEEKSNELLAVQNKLSTIDQRCTILEQEGDILKKNIRDMGKAWMADKADFASETYRLQAEILGMEAEQEEMIGEYQSLLEIKVALDNEIATYRALLEGEESR